MKKIELVYRHICEHVLSDRKAKFVEREIAKALGISPNTVSIAVAPLKRSGAVDSHLRYFELINFEKLLVFWAVNRQLQKDVIYSTYARMRNAEEVEKRMPNDVAYTCCSAYKNIFGNDVSDYGSVYVYATEKAASEIKKRFPENRLSVKIEAHNLFVLKPDPILEAKIISHELDRSSVSLPQLYVDLWNTKEWYSYEFLKRLKKRLDDKYGKAILE